MNIAEKENQFEWKQKLVIAKRKQISSTRL